MRARLRAAAALTALLPLTACGIQETDVIGAGGGATVDVLPAREVRMLLFFLSPDGLLMPSSRIVAGGGFEGGRQGPDRAEEIAPPSTEETVAALLSGPTPPERRAGMGNEPSLPDPSTRVGITASGGRVQLDLAAPLDGLTERAEGQLVCTVAYAESAAGSVPVTLRGMDGTHAPARCDLPEGEPANTGTAPR